MKSWPSSMTVNSAIASSSVPGATKSVICHDPASDPSIDPSIPSRSAAAGLASSIHPSVDTTIRGSPAASHHGPPGDGRQPPSR